MTRHNPLLPDYQGANLAGLVPAFLASAMDRPDWVPEPARSAGQVVLLVVDGLGWLQWQDRLHLTPHLADCGGGPITSVVPSTTATALTSLTVGVPPARHGIVGYRIVVDGPTGREVMNVLRWKTVSGDARGFVSPQQFQPLPPFQGRRVPVVSKSEFAGTGFTEAHQRDVPIAGWALASSLAVETGLLLQAGEPFGNADDEGLDADIRGFGPYYDAELIALDRMVGDLLYVLPAGAALAVTADHGQVDVGARAEVLDERVLKEAALVSGEARFRWLHTEPGASPDRLFDVARAVYSEQAWVVTVEEMERDGWFGGALPPEVRARVGEVAILPHEPVAYLDPADGGEARLVCRHGSLTAEEMLVPLLAG